MQDKIMNLNKNISDLDLSNIKKNYLEEARKNKDSNFYTVLTSDKIENKNNGLLKGTFYFSKDNVWTKNILTTASSKILQNFIPAEDATVIKLLNEAGAELLGKTVLDELGMGGTGLHAATGHVYNPLDKTRIAGGSSSGSVFATAKKIGNFSIGTDTGDSIRKPASLCGLVGFKPSYGSISRYGVIPYTPSLDHVGFLTNCVEDLFPLSEVTFKYDEKDFTSIDNSFNYTSLIDKKTNKKKVGYFRDVKKYCPKDLWIQYEEYFKKLSQQGYEIIELDFDKNLLDSIGSIYMMISFSEAVSTSANLDGINFGSRVDGNDYVEVMKKTRTDGFGELVKKRFIIGSYLLKSENQVDLLLKSKQIRRLIFDAINDCYKKCDFIVMPPSIEKAKLISECSNQTIENENFSEEANFLNNILVLANFNGMPSITIPFVTQDNLPIGINLNAPYKEDRDLLMFAHESESLINSMEGRKI